MNALNTITEKTDIKLYAVLGVTPAVIFAVYYIISAATTADSAKASVAVVETRQDKQDEFNKQMLLMYGDIKGDLGEIKGAIKGKNERR